MVPGNMNCVKPVNVQISELKTTLFYLVNVGHCTFSWSTAGCTFHNAPLFGATLGLLKILILQAWS